MSTNPGRPTLQELMSRVAALEQAHASLLAELTSTRGARAAIVEQEPMVGSAPATTSTQGIFASNVLGTPVVTASGTIGATGVQSSSERGFGVFGQSTITPISVGDDQPFPIYGWLTLLWPEVSNIPPGTQPG